MGIQRTIQSVIYMLRYVTLPQTSDPVRQFHITKVQAMVVRLDVSLVLKNATLLNSYLLLHHIISDPFKKEPRTNLSIREHICDGTTKPDVCL